MAWVLDLDGVIWLGETAIVGSSAAVAQLRDAGEEVVFITNNSYAPVEAVEAKLAAQGIPASGAVVTSALAAAELLEPGQRVLVCGGPGLRQALTARGLEVIDAAEVVDNAGRSTAQPRFDVVAVGFHRDFDWERMRVAASAIRQGARLVATNDDATYPTAEGPVPGGGAILASIERASGVRATVAGKPYKPMADLVRARLGGKGIVVGDRPDTDGRFAHEVGYRYGLVLSGVTHAADLPVEPEPDVVADDLAALVEEELGPVDQAASQ